MSWHIATADALPPLDTAAAFEQIEARLPSDLPSPPDAAVRVLAWRCDAQPSPEDVARLLRTSDATVAMLTMREEVPLRGRLGAVSAIAACLDAGYAVALAEAAAAGRSFDCESVALLSPCVLLKLGLQRLPTPRPGGGSPCAVIGQLPVEGVDVTLASVALDTSDSPDWRAKQMQALLDSIDAYDRYLPVLIGGDMATTTFTFEELADARRQRRRLTSANERLVPPAGHEPMFDLLRRRGYDWRLANVPLAPTGRNGPAGLDGPAYKRLWFFARGLVCDEPKVLPAQDGAGLPMGSYDAISLRIRPA